MVVELGEVVRSKFSSWKLSAYRYNILGEVMVYELGKEFKFRVREIAP